MRSVHIIGVPLDLGGNRRGTDMGPSAFRIAGLAEQLATLGLKVVDKGDVPSPLPEQKGAGDPHKRYVKDIARVCQRLFQASLSSFSEGAMPIVLGGDHSLGAGSVAAASAHLRKSGKSLGLIPIPEFCSNVTFGGRDGRTLYMTCQDKLYSQAMRVRGGQLAK